MKDLYLYITNEIHPASLLLTVGFDLLWSVFEGGLTASVVGIIALPFLFASIFLTCFTGVTLIQRYSANDNWGAALSKGFVLAILAAIPCSVIGILAGAFWGVMRLTYGVDPEVILLGKLTRSWREVEVTLRRMAPADFKYRGLDEVIDYLYSQGYLTSSLRERLHELRTQRNKNMHEFSTQELAVLVDQVQAMENTLRMKFLRR